jgi:hypothetical protein
MQSIVFCADLASLESGRNAPLLVKYATKTAGSFCQNHQAEV